MARVYDIVNLINGFAELEYLGNLYEYADDTEDGKYIFKCVTDNSCVTISKDELEKDSLKYKIRFKEQSLWKH